MSENEIIEILQSERNCLKSDLEQYVDDNKGLFQNFKTKEDVLDDFDQWREQSDIITEKIIDANYWTSV